MPARSRAAARSSRAPTAPSPSRPIRSPQTITTLPALAQDVGDLGAAASAVSAQRRGELGEEGAGAAGRVAGGRLGAAVERGRAVGRDGEPGAVAAHRLADPQVEDRRAVQRVGADDEDRVGVVDVTDPRRELGLGEPHQSLAARRRGETRESTCGEPSASRTMRWTR